MNKVCTGSLKTLTESEIKKLVCLRDMGDIGISDVHLLAENRKWNMYCYICYGLREDFGITTNCYDDISINKERIHGYVEDYYNRDPDSKYKDIWGIFEQLKEDGYLEAQGNGYVLSVDPDSFALSTREVKRLGYINALLKGDLEYEI